MLVQSFGSSISSCVGQPSALRQRKRRRTASSSVPKRGLKRRTYKAGSRVRPREREEAADGVADGAHPLRGAAARES